MDMEQLKRFVALENEKKELQAKVKSVIQKIDALDALITPQMIADGVQSMNVDGRTVYIARDIFAGPIDGQKENVIDALKATDETAGFVAENYNSQRLVAYVREVAADVEAACKQDQRMYDEDAVRAALSPQLAVALKISFIHSLRSRKA